jgi:hypothetical protein
MVGVRVRRQERTSVYNTVEYQPGGPSTGTNSAPSRLVGLSSTFSLLPLGTPFLLIVAVDLSAFVMNLMPRHTDTTLCGAFAVALEHSHQVQEATLIALVLNASHNVPRRTSLNLMDDRTTIRRRRR